MKQKHVFISHTWGADKQGHEWAVHLSNRLHKEYGINCWIDDQEQNLNPGGGLNQQIQLAIQDCPAFVAILCKTYKTRENCMAELEHAFTHKKEPIPALREKMARANFPEGLNAHDAIVYLEMFDVPSFDANLPKLAKAILRKCRIFWLRMASLIAIGIVSTVLLLVFIRMNWDPRANNKARRNASVNEASSAVLRRNRITVPKDGETVSFRKGGGQGGLVKIEGESKELGQNDEVIILVVYPSDGNAYPQTNQPKGTTPAPNGNWSADVQVGNLDSDPQAGQSFTVKMYVLTIKDYLSVKNDNLQTGGRAKWPPALSSAYPEERAKVTFVLK